MPDITEVITEKQDGEFVRFPDSPFELFQPYPPAGDQPEAINKLVEGLNDGETFQTLLGVTGSGKTFTMANVIARLGRPAIIFAPNKTLAAQLYSEFREFFPKNAVEYFVSYYDYYQPEAYVPQRDLFIEKDSAINEHIEQMRLSATPSDYELEHAGQVLEQVVRPTGLVDPQIEVRPASSQVDDVLSEISACVSRRERVLVTTLTKRMAEDLTDFLSDHQIKVRYLHSDVETVERVEIIRDLRLGVFDVLVGINLLREGLDIPEVALVAILDADKEGFLRSERSLIQTVGRAARHLEGRAILYGDRITRSMERAIQETTRRREKQIAFNRQHGITPRGVIKQVKEMIDGVYDATQGRDALKAAEQVTRYEALSEKSAARELKRLEKVMLEHARNLEFEKAAQARDQLAHLKEQLFGASGVASEVTAAALAAGSDVAPATKR